MGRRLGLHLTLDVPAAEAVAALRGSAGSWLPLPVAAPGGRHWRIYLWAAQLGVLVDCVVGDPWSEDGRLTRSLSWSPLRAQAGVALRRAVPAFAGELEVIDRGDGVAELHLGGIYTPPGGVAGSLLDRVVMHWVARRTVRTLLLGIADRLRGAPRVAAA